MIFAIFNSTLKNLLGTKNFIVLGFFLLTITIAGLGIIANVEDSGTFVALALVLRFIMGAGDIIVEICI